MIGAPHGRPVKDGSGEMPPAPQGIGPDERTG